jgi:signal transduction histidine kinase
MVAETVDVVRNIAVHLRPATLDLGLVPAVRSLIKGFETSTGIDCELQIDPPNLAVDEPRLTTAFRIIQAALTNITLHSDADKAQVQLKLQASSGALVISIHDEGKGFDTDDVLSFTDGMGIAGIRERTEHLGGQFGLISEVGKGTEIVCSLPELDHSRKKIYAS